MLPEQDRSTFPAADPEPAGKDPIPADLPENPQLLQLQHLLRIATAANASASLEDALDIVTNRLKDSGMGDRISILLPNPAGELQIAASAGYSQQPNLDQAIAMNNGMAGKSAAERRPLRVDDASTAIIDFNLDPGVQSQLAIPLLFRDELCGVLNLESDQANHFDETDQELLMALGVSLGGMIANFRLVEQARRQVLHERQLFEATSHIRRAVDLQGILETAARELAQNLGARRVHITLTTGEIPDGSDPPGQNDTTSGARGQEIDNR